MPQERLPRAAATRPAKRGKPIAPATAGRAHPTTGREPAPAAKPRAEQRMDTDYDPNPRAARKASTR